MVCFLLLIILGVTSARVDLKLLKGESGDQPHHEDEPCCDSCTCTKSTPPKCHCQDVRLNSCHSACTFCACSQFYPEQDHPQCRCLETTEFCYKPCKSKEDDDLMTKF
ncbi:hypothetical protein RJT34_26148 [Clitoria ternatea]|uniref:Bowman-Birk serine protease inhibitors family domain-containing protein n=1 Tax=Clitoria ternatea TaxID=43366 RepID=A0AAN9FB02_CLITE